MAGLKNISQQDLNVLLIQLRDAYSHKKQMVKNQILGKAFEWVKFLANGGEVREVSNAQSGALVTNWNGSQKSAQTTMRSVMAVAVAEAHARRNNPNVIARNDAREKGVAHFHGAKCKNCGGTYRYTSINACFTCNKVSALKNHKKRIGRAA